MDPLFITFLVIHIVSGGIALLIGSYIMIAAKGDRKHVLSGKIFAVSMYVCAVAGLVMALLHNSIFLLCISVFTIFMLTTGLQGMALVKGRIRKSAPILIISATMVLFSMGLIYFGVVNEFNVVILAFGAGSLVMCVQDFMMFFGRTKLANPYYLLHIQRMTGAYIAAFTAFLVVNNTFLPAVVAWLAPSVVGSILITVWSRKHAKLKHEN
ncbi:DUF2306 domain-containing protein [Flavobacterium aurantiibacter]|uniref:DUF2306 domain-containing protein n=1 Tax=Flavobacterium aurantiibacter TaxID=2023067 RepID=A0A256A0Z9_9FLAO|nr:hypothetical protein [Flavobacterium aurantiibacter]OYQ47438.1 hypothetical protein CHX27_02995 [Flavobacterium aurantiibacter]